MKTMTVLGVSLATLAAAVRVQAGPAEVRLVEKGKAQCVIVVPKGSMKWEGDTKRLNWREEFRPGNIEETQRRLQRDSVKDLALYLGKMSGATIEIAEGLPAGERRVPIFIGAEAQAVFGPVGLSQEGLYGFRVVAGKKGVGLYGESGFGTSYAIYELLYRLGCRWFMPTELGECVPSLTTLTVPEMDEKLAPATVYRRYWQGGEDYLRRNRMNGVGVSGGQGALESWLSKEELAQHPEWQMVNNGKPSGMFRFTNPEVAKAIAANIIKHLDKNYETSISLTPGDYVMAADDPEDMKCDPTPRVWEPAAGRWSITDRFILLANRVAEEVGKKYPKVRFGILAYVNYSMPPARYPVHSNIVVTIAPIDFNRHHPMTWTNHPNEFWLRDMVEGWGQKASHLAAY